MHNDPRADKGSLFIFIFYICVYFWKKHECLHECFFPKIYTYIKNEDESNTLYLPEGRLALNFPTFK